MYSLVWALKYVPATMASLLTAICRNMVGSPSFLSFKENTPSGNHSSLSVRFSSTAFCSFSAPRPSQFAAPARVYCSFVFTSRPSA